MSDYYESTCSTVESGCCLKCESSYPGCICFNCKCTKCKWYTSQGSRRCGKIENLNDSFGEEISNKIENTNPKCFHYNECGGFRDRWGDKWPHEDCFFVCKYSRVFKMLTAYEKLTGLDWEEVCS